MSEALTMALAMKLGTRAVIEQRFADMCSSGLLVLYPYDD
jgi:hypothetical protein